MNLQWTFLVLAFVFQLFLVNFASSESYENSTIVYPEIVYPDYSDNPIPCRVPGIKHGSIRRFAAKGEEYEVGYQAVSGSIGFISCMQGYSIEREGTIVCAFNGTWLPKVVPCISIPETSCYCPYRINGTMTVNNATVSPYEYVPIGSKIRLACADGYSIDGAVDSKCTKHRIWSPRLGYCEEIVYTTYKPATEKMKKYVPELGDAVASGNLSLVAEFVKEQDADINAIGYPKPAECECGRNWSHAWNMSAFHMSVMCCQKQIFFYLLQQVSDVNSKDAFGYSALLRAAENGETEIAGQLIEKGADVNASTNENYTSLILASKNGHFDIVELLLNASADVNACQSSGFTALTMAAYIGNVNLTRSLLNAGAELNWQTDVGYTALMFAARNDHWETAKLLLEEGASRQGCLYRLCF